MVSLVVLKQKQLYELMNDDTEYITHSISKISCRQLSQVFFLQLAKCLRLVQKNLYFFVQGTKKQIYTFHAFSY